MIRRPPRSTQSRSSAASDVYKRQIDTVASQQVYVLGNSACGHPAIAGMVLVLQAVPRPSALRDQCRVGVDDCVVGADGRRLVEDVACLSEAALAPACADGSGEDLGA